MKQNIKEYNLERKLKVLIVFDDMIADMMNNKKLNSIVINCLLQVENLIFLLFLIHNHILKYQKKLD